VDSIASSYSEPVGDIVAAIPPWRQRTLKRDIAVGIVEAFIERLGALKLRSAVLDETTRVVEQLVDAQGAAEDQSYLVRSLCRVATAVRKAGWPAVASVVVEGAIERGQADAYVFGEAVHCRLAAGDWQQAEALMDRARNLKLTSSAAYTSMLTAFARLGWVERCGLVFEKADADGVLTSECCAAMIRACGKAGRLERAIAAFERAQAFGCDQQDCYQALITAYAHSGRAGDARAVFDQAGRRGYRDKRLFTSLIVAYCTCGYSREAERVLDVALALGEADDISVMCLVEWYGARRHFRRAEKLLREGESRGLTLSASYDALAGAYRKHRCYSAARRLDRHKRATAGH